MDSTQRTEAIKQLREITGQNLKLCKDALEKCNDALEKCNWDVKEADKLLFTEIEAKAFKSKDKKASEGKIVSYVHQGRIAALVEVNCQTDFAANSEEFGVFCETLLTQIVGAAPKFLDRDSVDEQELEKVAAVARQNGMKTAELLDAYFDQWFSETCLMSQIHVDESFGGKTIEQLRTELSAKLGENIVIRRFVRWELGNDS